MPCTDSAAQALEAPERSATLTCTNGRDTIYRVLEDVTATLRKTQQRVVHQSAEKSTGAQGRNVQRGIVKMDRCKRPNVKHGAGALEASGAASAARETAMDMAYHDQASRRPHVVGVETSGTGSGPWESQLTLKGETYPQLGVGQNSRSGDRSEFGTPVTSQGFTVKTVRALPGTAKELHIEQSMCNNSPRTSAVIMKIVGTLPGTAKELHIEQRAHAAGGNPPSTTEGRTARPAAVRSSRLRKIGLVGGGVGAITNM